MEWDRALWMGLPDRGGGLRGDGPLSMDPLSDEGTLRYLLPSTVRENTLHTVDMYDCAENTEKIP